MNDDDTLPALQDDEHWARAIVEAAPAGMIMIDGRGRIVLANRVVETLFGFEPAELVGQPVETLVPLAHREAHPGHVAEFFRSAVPVHLGFGRDLVAEDRHGRPFPVDVALTPIETSRGPCALATIVDLTERKRVERELTAARLVQQAMLPLQTPDHPHVEVAGRCVPAVEAGGDFFDYWHLPDDRLGACIGDASGHGFGAALVVASARSYLRATVRVQERIDHLLSCTNELLLEDLPEERFVTLFVVEVDPRAGQLTYCGAGHQAYVFGPDGRLRETLGSSGPPLGWFPSPEYEIRTTSFDVGDTVLLTTDGVEEAHGPSDSLFTRPRVFEFVESHATLAPAELVDGLLAEVETFRGPLDPSDDTTVVVLKRTA